MAHNLAVIRHAALNTLKADPSRGSLRRKRLKAAIDPNFHQACSLITDLGFRPGCKERKERIQDGYG